MPASIVVQDLTAHPLPRRHPRPTVGQMVAFAARGFAMGAASLVPGVSAGTVALVLGIYERLVSNVHEAVSSVGRLLRGDRRVALDHLRRVEPLFLVPLVAGVGVAVLALAHLIEVALDQHPVPMGGLFFGLVTASAVVAWRLLDRVDLGRVAIMAVTTGITFFVFGVTAGERSDAGAALVFASGALAVCAMILPGISGSFLLLAIGTYELVLGAISHRDLAIVGVFVAGCVVGLALFSSLLNWALAHHRASVLAALTGLMVGSLRVLWPWPVGTEETGLAAPGELWGLAAVIAVAAAGAVLVAAEVERRLELARVDTADPPPDPPGPPSGASPGTGPTEPGSSREGRAS